MNENTKLVNGVEFDLVVASLNIIDKCASRGAFHGSELSLIGNIRDRLGKIVEDQKERDR